MLVPMATLVLILRHMPLGLICTLWVTELAVMSCWKFDCYAGNVTVGHAGNVTVSHAGNVTDNHAGNVTVSHAGFTLPNNMGELLLVCPLLFRLYYH